MGGAASAVRNDDTTMATTTTTTTTSSSGAFGGAGAATGALEGTLKCSLQDHQIQQFVESSHFTKDEVIALSIHYDQISSSQRDDGLIDRSEFQVALGFPLKESVYVDRIFHLFDSNNDSFISFSEFLQNVSILSSKGTLEEKLKFSFDVLDLDRDGRLSKQELLSMLEVCVQENGIEIPRASLETIIAKTFEEVDLDRDEFISMQEYRTLAERNPSMLSHMTFNISSIIADYLPLLRAQMASAATTS